MKRSNLNFLVDAVAFVMFLFLVVTGVIMEFILPSGTGHWTTLWGLDRHGWGDVHFWFSVVFLAALALHVYLHWKWIVSVLRGRPREGSGTRLGLGAVGLVALLLIAVAPLLSPVERTANSRANTEPRWGLSAEAEALQGSTTIEEVVGITGVSLEYLADALGLPADVSLDDRLGQLARENGFSVAEVREIVEQGRALSDQKEVSLSMAASAPELPTTVVAQDTAISAMPEAAPPNHELQGEDHEPHEQDHEPGSQAGLADIRGSTTIGEIVELGVPLAVLQRELGLPSGTPLVERLGRLARVYGFTLTQVRDLVDSHR